MFRDTVRQLFFEAMAMDPESQVALLDRAGAPPEVRAAVLTLLPYDRESETFLSEAVAWEFLPPAGAGERFGAYQLCELLGRGGMGAVFRAERVDGELRLVAAVKVVERSWLDSRAYERFRQERQILSSLVHPNIAHLLDGGTREDGTPYLVMEYVEGVPIDEYCTSRALGIAERLSVFLPLCEAVEFAHRKLIVHRDLKPSNVLVMADGTPKLLDFGVAKALDPGLSGTTQTLVLTPDFASPEQVLGHEITTSTDVYGLGAVLYQVLLERPPHVVTDLSPAGLQRAVCDKGPKPPSSIRADLKGDLENILMKALQPEPATRYGSARELQDDIERYLDHKPVRATPQRWRYRARRFIERHTVATVAATLALAAVLAGSGIAVYEAHRARQRFEQVRELANRFILDFEKSIRDVPGTLAVRQKMAATARTYLENLAADTKSNLNLVRELAESYYQLSRIDINIGQSDAGRGAVTRVAARDARRLLRRTSAAPAVCQCAGGPGPVRSGCAGSGQGSADQPGSSEPIARVGEISR